MKEIGGQDPGGHRAQEPIPDESSPAHKHISAELEIAQKIKFGVLVGVKPPGRLGGYVEFVPRNLVGQYILKGYSPIKSESSWILN